MASCSDFAVAGEVHTLQEYATSVTFVAVVITGCLGMPVEVATSCYNHLVLVPSSNSKGRYMTTAVEKMAAVACRNPSSSIQIFKFHAAGYLDRPSKDSLAASMHTIQSFDAVLAFEAEPTTITTVLGNFVMAQDDYCKFTNSMSLGSLTAGVVDRTNLRFSSQINFQACLSSHPLHLP